MCLIESYPTTNILKRKYLLPSLIKIDNKHKFEIK